MKFDFAKAIFLVFLIVSFGMSARILGADPLYIDIFDSILYMMMMLVMCLIVLFLGGHALAKILAWVDGSTADGRKSSVYPILSVLLNLVVVMSFTYIVMSHFGFDLMVIVTSLGLVGLAISFGAQSTLQQFFSGLGLMLTRSIKTGDVVRLQGDDTRLIVQSIGMMTTTFMSMENSEIIIMPNNVISGATVFNMTADAEYYGINLIMQFRVDNRNLREVQKHLTQSAYGIEHIVTDGSLPIPEVQFMRFEGGNVSTKIIAYLDDVHNYDEAVSNLIISVTETTRKLDLLPNGGLEMHIEEVKYERK